MTCVLVVDNSPFMQRVLDSALTNAGYDVLIASDIDEAINTIETHEPDVVTMDVETTGDVDMRSVERIMSSAPLPILMLSSQECEQTIQSTPEWGALELLEKPVSTGPQDSIQFTDRVVEAVADLSNATVSSVALARATVAAISGEQSRQGETDTELGENRLKVRHRPDWAELAEETPAPIRKPCQENPTIIVGASTGGPKIVEQLFSQLPRELDAKVLVVQHMPAEFTGRFADRLDSISEYDVAEVLNGDRIGSGEALVSPGGYHLEVAHNIGGTIRVRLGDDEPVHGVRPAIDVTMRTAAERVVDPLCGVVLTGMGRDGAEGIREIKAAGGRTIAQDEATSPVFGIPSQAIKTGCVDETVPADALVDRLIDAFTTDGENDD